MLLRLLLPLLLVAACDREFTAPEPAATEPDPPAFAVISAGLDHSCGILADGALACWGRVAGVDAAVARLQPALTGPASSFAAVSAGTAHTCALAAGGGVRCWGANDRLQLGTGTTVDATEPAELGGPVNAFQAISSGAYHTCAITLDDLPYCWGWNRYGQLGNSSSIGQGLPVLVHGNVSARAIAAGGTHTCAITTDGRALCWGSGARGQLGDGAAVERQAPVEVAGARTFAAVAAGQAHTCALATDGSAWCWGAGEAGQLGNGATVDAHVPVPVGGGHAFVSISAGSEHTCAVDGAGVAWCWGHNAHGRLGTGGLPTILAQPARVAGELVFRSVSAGRLHSCGVTTSDVGYCWGFGGFGQLGTGSVVSHPAPVPVAPAQ